MSDAAAILEVDLAFAKMTDIAEANVEFSGAVFITGPRGPSSDSINVWEIEQLVSSNGAQNINLPAVPVKLKSLSINGLGQSNNSYTLIESQLVLPADLQLMTGDIVRFSFVS